jgi:hypothetical protein
MNQTSKGLLVALLLVSASAQAYTNKTFLMPRSEGSDLAMESTGWCARTMQNSGKKENAKSKSAACKNDSHVSVTGYYRASNNEAELGKYFLVGNKSKIVLQSNAGNLTALPAGVDVDLDTVLNNHDVRVNGTPANDNVLTAPAGKATLQFAPEHKSWGAHLNAHRDLSDILQGLYAGASMAVVRVENDVKAKVSGTAGTGANLADYLAGKYEVAQGSDVDNAQAKLLYAKAGKTNVTGVADVDMHLGYKIIENDWMHLGVAFAATLPTGNAVTGEHIFEAIAGNAGHWAVGANANAGMRVWGNEEHSIHTGVGLKYRYLLEGDENRTFGLKAGNTAVPFGQYALLGRTGFYQVTPAANVLNMTAQVTPGSQVDAALKLGYHNGGFAVDAGYNLFWKEAEKVTRKTKFAEGVWALANAAYDTSTRYTLNDDVVAGPVALANLMPSLTQGGTRVASVDGAAAGAVTGADAVELVNNILLKVTEMGGQGQGTNFTRTADNGDILPPIRGNGDNIPNPRANVGHGDFSAVGTAVTLSGEFTGARPYGIPLAEANIDNAAATTPSALSHSVYGSLGYCFQEWENPLALSVGGKYEFASENSAVEQWGVWLKAGLSF